MADASLGPYDLQLDFIFVPHGAPEPTDWMARHPGWIKIPATMVPRGARSGGRFGPRDGSPHPPARARPAQSERDTSPPYPGAARATPVAWKDPKHPPAPIHIDERLIEGARKLLDFMDAVGQGVMGAGPWGEFGGEAVSMGAEELEALLPKAEAALGHAPLGEAAGRAGGDASAGLGAEGGSAARAPDVPMDDGSAIEIRPAHPTTDAPVAHEPSPGEPAPSVTTPAPAAGDAARGAGLRAAEHLAPIARPDSGWVGSSLRAGNEARIVPRDPEALALVKRIANEGDPTGRLTEQAVELIAKDEGLQSLAGGKYAGDHGFDHVFRAPDGSVTLLMESKQVQSGAMRLAKEGAGKQMQMSDDWVTRVLVELDPASEAYKAVESALESKTLIKAVIGVDRKTGELIMYRVQ